MVGQKPITYWDYIRVPDLLTLQGGTERDVSDLAQDEVAFITIHQVYELWLKLILRDLVVACDLFAQGYVPDDALAGASRLLGRIRIIDWSIQPTPSSTDSATTLGEWPTRERPSLARRRRTQKT